MGTPTKVKCLRQLEPAFLLRCSPDRPEESPALPVDRRVQITPVQKSFMQQYSQSFEKASQASLHS